MERYLTQCQIINQEHSQIQAPEPWFQSLCLYIFILTLLQDFAKILPPQGHDHPI